MHWKGTPQVLHIDKLNASREFCNSENCCKEMKNRLLQKRMYRKKWENIHGAQKTEE
jgi:hypothetical protein